MIDDIFVFAVALQLHDTREKMLELQALIETIQPGIPVLSTTV